MTLERVIGLTIHGRQGPVRGIQSILSTAGVERALCCETSWEESFPTSPTTTHCGTAIKIMDPYVFIDTFQFC